MLQLCVDVIPVDETKVDLLAIKVKRIYFWPRDGSVSSNDVIQCIQIVNEARRFNTTYSSEPADYFCIITIFR